MVAPNEKALAMWLEFMAVSARLPMPVKDKMYQVITNAELYSFCPNHSPIELLLLNGISVKPAI